MTDAKRDTKRDAATNSLNPNDPLKADTVEHAKADTAEGALTQTLASAIEVETNHPATSPPVPPPNDDVPDSNPWTASLTEISKDFNTFRKALADDAPVDDLRAMLTELRDKVNSLLRLGTHTHTPPADTGDVTGDAPDEVQTSKPGEAWKYDFLNPYNDVISFQSHLAQLWEYATRGGDRVEMAKVADAANAKLTLSLSAV